MKIFLENETKKIRWAPRYQNFSSVNLLVDAAKFYENVLNCDMARHDLEYFPRFMFELIFNTFQEEKLIYAMSFFFTIAHKNL